MFQGRYVHWNPIAKFEGKRMYCEAVHDDWEGFRIWLSPEKPLRMLIVRFEHAIFYANSNEGKRLSAVENDDEMDFPMSFGRSKIQHYSRNFTGSHLAPLRRSTSLTMLS
jgi:hypothetical protein